MEKHILDKISLKLMKFSTFIEIKNENINSIYISEEKNITEILYIRDNYEEGDDKYFEKESLGSTLVSILNNYNEIILVVDKYKNIILNEKYKLMNKVTKEKLNNYIDFCINAVLLFKDKLKNINKKLCILDVYIYKFLKDFDSTYLTETTKNSNEDEILNYICIEFRRFFEKLKILYIEGKELVDNSFVFNNETKNYKFAKINSVIPPCNLEYITENLKFPQPFKYIYEISNVKDVFFITIYQLLLNHKIIIKCKNCGKYLIPDRTHKQYCDNDCRWKYIRRKAKENESESYKYYRILYNRYKNAKTYAKEFQNLKNIYYDTLLK